MNGQTFSQNPHKQGISHHKATILMSSQIGKAELTLHSADEQHVSLIRFCGKADMTY